jgi:hypothetical protein
MSGVVVAALVIVAVIVAAGFVLLIFVVRDAWPSRGEWAEEDRAAGEDTRRGIADKDFPFGPLPPIGM